MEDDEDVEVIMPLTINKYHGSVFLRTDSKSVKYRGIFESNSTKKLRGTFDSFEKGFEWIKVQNELEGNEKVKNIICKRGNEYQCLLTDDVVMRFDADDIGLVHAHIWHAHYGYACTNILGLNGDATGYSFHTLLIGYPPEGQVIDHKDRNRANNKDSNLRFVTPRVNNINIGTQKNNTSGTRGVRRYQDNRCNGWLVSWRDENGKARTKYFSILELGEEGAERQAIEFRKMIETTLAHYIEGFEYET